MTLKSRSNDSIEVPVHGWKRKSWLNNFFSMLKSNNTLEPQIHRKAMIVDLEYPAADALLIANNKGVTEGGINIIIKLLNNIWAKVFKNGPNKICGRQPLKNLKLYDLWSRPYHFNFFKGSLPQILLGPFLNTLPHFFLRFS